MKFKISKQLKLFKFNLNRFQITLIKLKIYFNSGAEIKNAILLPENSINLNFPVYRTMEKYEFKVRILFPTSVEILSVHYNSCVY